MLFGEDLLIKEFEINGEDAINQSNMTKSILENMDNQSYAS